MTDFSLASRYASPEMQAIFAPTHKYAIWRKLWIALAKAEQKVGLPISSEAIADMEKHVHNIDMERASFYEKKFCHDVVAHIHTFAEIAPSAAKIIHLGATSCYVTDNADLIQIKEGLCLLQKKLAQAIRFFSEQAEKYLDLPCLSYTHLQPAQPTTVGKRICLWIQDFALDLKQITDTYNSLSFLGLKGATGTQASFLTLCDGDRKKVDEIEKLIAAEMGFSSIISLSGQTYTRKQDIYVFNSLGSLAVSSHKFGTDLRLLSHMKEMEEPFGQDQVGSSAMPHKRNPIRAERLCSLARYLLSLQENPLYTAATQWLERSLDDSANRRITIPAAFLFADALVNLLLHLASGLIVYPKMVEKRLKEELPFFSLETILMTAVKKGGDRQKLHTLLKEKSHEASVLWKKEGLQVDLLDSLIKNPDFPLTQEDLTCILDAHLFTGAAASQAKKFLCEEITPLLQNYKPLDAVPQVEI